MKNLNNYIIEKLKLNKDIKKPTLLDNYDVDDNCLLLTVFPHKNDIIWMPEAVKITDKTIHKNDKFIYFKYITHISHMETSRTQNRQFNYSENKEPKYIIADGQYIFEILLDSETSKDFLQKFKPGNKYSISDFIGDYELTYFNDIKDKKLDLTEYTDKQYFTKKEDTLSNESLKELKKVIK